MFYQLLDSYTLKNSQVEVRILDYGGIITNIFAPDKNGKVEDILLGFDAYKGMFYNMKIDLAISAISASGTNFSLFNS